MKTVSALLILILFAASTARAVILLDTGNPTVNTTAPGGTLINSGWQYEGEWGGLLGTPIAPHFFISAAHIGYAGLTFSFQGSSYTIVRSFSLADSDFLIWQVNETFPSFAPLYSKRDEVSQHLVVIGRGTERGAEVMLNNTPPTLGWYWMNPGGTQRWGENDVTAVVPYNGHDLLYATFDQHTQPNDRPNEAHLSTGDSGGAVFLNDGGVWKLAGINYSVDGYFYARTETENGPVYDQFIAALFDSRGFYYSDEMPNPTYTLITGNDPVPTGFYSSRISSELPWICSVIADPQVGREGNFLTLTYSKLVAPATEVTYQVEQSTDLVTWSPADTQDQIIGTAGDLQTIKSKIDIGTSTYLFARLSVTRPSAPSAPKARRGAKKSDRTAAPKLHPSPPFKKLVPLDN